MEPLTDGEEGGDVPNEKNLVSNGQRTPNERRENARKAGKASGAARRRKKQAAQYMRILMETAATEELAQKLQEQGFDEEDCTYAAALAWKMLMQGLKGNVKAASLVYKIAEQAEAAEAAEKERRAAKRRAKQEQQEAVSDGFLEAIAAAAANAFPAGDNSAMLPEPDDETEEDEDAPTS